MSNKTTYLILGHGKHGKDTFAELFCECQGINFLSSSFALSEEVAYPALKVKYGYKNAQECYEDRRNHRTEWRDLLSEYNTPDKTKLARKILERVPVYTGMRTLDEYEACMKQNLFDVVYYVRATPRLKEDDPSMGIPFDPSRMILIDNSGSKEDLKSQVSICAELIEGKANLIKVVSSL